MKTLITSLFFLLLLSCNQKEYNYGVTELDLKMADCQQLQDIFLFCTYKIKQLKADYWTSNNPEEKQSCYEKVTYYKIILGKAHYSQVNCDVAKNIREIDSILNY